MENVSKVENIGDKSNTNKIQLIKKIGNITINVLLYAFLIFSLFSVVVSVVLKKNSDGAVTIFGHQIRIVVSDSMAKCDETYKDIKKFKIKDIPVKSMILIDVMPEDDEKAEEWYDSIREGDVLTFKYTYTKQETITHRVISCKKNDDGNGWTIVLKGDNKASKNSETLEQVIDTSIPNNTNYVIGRVVSSNYFFGSILTFIKQPLGIILLVIIPCIIIIVLEIIRLVSFFLKEKQQKFDSETQKNKDEIEELKKQLEMLVNEKAEVITSLQNNQEKQEITKEASNDKQEEIKALDNENLSNEKDINKDLAEKESVNDAKLTENINEDVEQKIDENNSLLEEKNDTDKKK